MAKAPMRPDVRVSAIVIRACKCGHKREIGKPCEGCGNRKVPKITDLGIIAANRRSFKDRLKWNLWGYHMAQHRIRKTNKEMLRSCG